MSVFWHDHAGNACIDLAQSVRGGAASSGDTLVSVFPAAGRPGDYRRRLDFLDVHSPEHAV